jgi:hypothetical protein
MVPEIAAIRHRFGKEGVLMNIIPFGQMCPHVGPYYGCTKMLQRDCWYRSNQNANPFPENTSLFALRTQNARNITIFAVHHID